jgi:uncharacterized protein
MLPIGDTIVFVEPLFLQAVEETGDGGGIQAKTAGQITEELTGGRTAIPELKRVIVANGDRLVMAGTLNDAINQLLSFRTTAPVPIVSGGEGSTPAQVPEEQQAAFADIVGQLLAHQAAAEQAAGIGDWETFGREMTAFNTVLDELNKLAGQ